MFFSSVALEFTCGIWSCTYLVSTEGLTESTAAKFLTLFYIGLTSGRFVSGLLSKIKPMNIVYLGYTIIGVAILTLILPIPATVKGVALFLIGFGIGPFFPNLTYLTPINFGKEISQSIVGTQMAMCNLGILLMPPVFGLIAEHVSVALFPFYVAILFIVMVLSTFIYNGQVKKMKGKKSN